MVLEVDLRILVINLNLVEAVVSHASCMHDESTLGKWIVIFVIHQSRLVHASGTRPGDWERVSRRRLREKRRTQLAFLVDDDHAPIVETTLPKFAEVDRQTHFVLSCLDYIATRNHVPGQD